MVGLEGAKDSVSDSQSDKSCDCDLRDRKSGNTLHNVNCPVDRYEQEFHDVLDINIEKLLQLSDEHCVNAIECDSYKYINIDSVQYVIPSSTVKIKIVNKILDCRIDSGAISRSFGQNM